MGAGGSPAPCHVQGEDSMRLDKFLQVSRLVKRRTVAQDLCRGGKVKLNGKAAKPGAQVSPGDTLEVGTGSRRILARVVDVPQRVYPGMDPIVEILED